MIRKHVVVRLDPDEEAGSVATRSQLCARQDPESQQQQQQKSSSSAYESNFVVFGMTPSLLSAFSKGKS